MLFMLLAVSAAACESDPPPKAQLEAFRKLPLTAEEFRAIDANVAPYLRQP